MFPLSQALSIVHIFNLLINWFSFTDQQDQKRKLYSKNDGCKHNLIISASPRIPIDTQDFCVTHCGRWYCSWCDSINIDEDGIIPFIISYHHMIYMTTKQIKLMTFILVLYYYSSVWIMKILTTVLILLQANQIIP